MSDNHFGERLKFLRKGKGMTLQQLADISGTSKSYVWELENKHHPRPSVDLVVKISGALGVGINVVMGWPDPFDDENSLLADYRMLTGEHKAMARELMSALADRVALASTQKFERTDEQGNTCESQDIEQGDSCE